MTTQGRLEFDEHVTHANQGALFMSPWTITSSGCKIVNPAQTLPDGFALCLRMPVLSNQ